MPTFPQVFDPSATTVRLANQDCQSTEPDPADFTYHPRVSSIGVTMAVTNIEDPTFRQGDASPPIPGMVEISGDIVASTAPDATIPLVAAALQRHSAVTDEGGGAYSIKFGPSQATDAGLATLEVDNSDSSPMVFCNVAPITMSYDLETGGMFTKTFTPAATFGSRWPLSVEAHPTPFTGRPLQLRGVAQQNVERNRNLAETARDVYFRLIKHESLTGTPRWIAVVGRPGPLTGTVEMTGTTELQGTGTSFTTEIYRGDLLDIDGNFLEVLAVTSDTSATLSAAATVSAGTTALREYGTAQSIQDATLGFDTPVGFDAQSFEQFRTVKDSVTGLRMGHLDTVGHPVEAFLFSRAGLPVQASVALTGTVTVTAGSDVITGIGTSFVTELEKYGELTTAGGQIVRIKEITSPTSALADGNFSTSEVSVAATYIGVPTFNLSGTWSATASTTLAGTGGAALTEVVTGQWIRAADGANQGVIARVVSIGDDNTIVVHQAVTIAAATTLETDVELKVSRERSKWAQPLLTAEGSGSPAVNFFLKLDLLRADGTPEEDLEERRVINFSIPLTTGAAPGQVPIGTAWAPLVQKMLLRSGTVSVGIEKTDDRLANLIERRPTARITIRATSGVRIGTSNREYSENIVFHGTITGTPIQASGAEDNIETLEVLMHPPKTPDPAYPDMFQVELYTDRSDPMAITPLT